MAAFSSICGIHFPMLAFNVKPGIESQILYYTERNFQTATRYFLIYLNIYYIYMAKIYTQYGKIK